MKHDCIFCKIARKEIPYEKIYENKSFVSFLDLSPVAKGHALIIPKKHFAWIQETDDKTLIETFRLSKKIMQAMKEGLKCDYVQVSVIGKDVQHFHVHLIPRLFDETLDWKTKKYQTSEKEIVAKKISQAL